MELNLGRVRCFVEVAQRGTVAAAASSLGYTGPAVSQQLSKLETEVGSTLFDRVGGRLVLNEAGQRFEPRALDIIDSVERATRELSNGQLPAKPIVIMGFPSVIFALVAPAISALAETPGPAIHPIEAEDAESLRELSLGNADIAIVQEHSHIRAERHQRFVYHHLRSDPMVIIASDRIDPLPSSLPALADADWVVSSAGTPCQESTDVACRLAGFEPRTVARVDELRNTMTLVAAMGAVSLVPQLALPGSYNGIVVADINTGITRDIYTVTRASADDRATGPIIDRLS